MAIVIAIDGPAASGKGTIGRMVAERLNFIYLDTGKLYRAVAWKFLSDGNHSLNDVDDLNSSASKFAVQLSSEISLNDLENPSLLSDDVACAASIISSNSDVRIALKDFQRNMAKSENGAVLDGRDIGSVICPDADFKFFITAGIEERARRRYKELQKQSDSVSYESVLQNLRERDERDCSRSAAPLVACDDAIVVDTSGRTIAESLEYVLSKISL